MTQAPAGGQQRREWLAVLLTASAGFVDAAGYLTLYHLFTAHMSGNSVGLGVNLGLGAWSEALRRGFPIPLFMIGVATGAAWRRFAIAYRIRSHLAPLLSVEAGLLGAFMLAGGAQLRAGSVAASPAWRFYLLVALPVLAMGLQNAAIRRVGRLTIHTTYVTAMLSSLAEEAVTGIIALAQLLGRPRQQRLEGIRRDSFAMPLFIACLCGGYLLGGILGAYLEQRWQLRALLAPLLLLAFLIAVDLWLPFSAEV